MSATLIDKDMGYKNALARLRRLAKKTYVVVGVRGEKGAPRVKTTTVDGARTSTPDSEALSLVEIAAVHEFGTEDGSVPERSFLRSSFDTNRPKYESLLKKAVQRVLDGKAEFKGELALLGLRATADVQTLIAAGQGIPPPLKPETIAAKGSTHTLIDTGRLRQSIDYEVREEK